MPSDLEPQQMPPAVPQNYEHKQKLEGQRPNNTQVNSSYRVRMIAQKCPPILRWRPSASAHVLGNRRLGDFESEHQKLTVNPGGAPQRILLAHPLNEFAQAAIDPWSPRPPPRFPSPKGPEARTMPTQDRLGLNHVGRAKKAGPNPYQPDHKHSITVAQLETRRPPSQCDTQLMTEEQVLGFKPHTRPEYVGDEPSKQLQDRKHRLNDATILPYDANPRRTEFSERTGAVSHGNASAICCASHSAVGCLVTANQRSCRRPWLTTRKANKHSNVSVGTRQRSAAAIAPRCGLLSKSAT